MDGTCACGNPAFGTCKACCRVFCRPHAPQAGHYTAPTYIQDRCQTCFDQEQAKDRAEVQRAQAWDHQQQDQLEHHEQEQYQTLAEMAPVDLIEYLSKRTPGGNGASPTGDLPGKRLRPFTAAETAEALGHAGGGMQPTQWIVHLRSGLRKKRQVSGWLVVRERGPGDRPIVSGFILAVDGQVFEGRGRAVAGLDDCVAHPSSFPLLPDDLRELRPHGKRGFLR